MRDTLLDVYTALRSSGVNGYKFKARSMVREKAEVSNPSDGNILHLTKPPLISILLMKCERFVEVN